MRKFWIAVFAIMLGVGAIGTVSNSWATSYDPTGVAGNFPLPPATPMIWNHGAVGDALFGEMYRAVLGTFDETFNFATYISIENVSPYWVAAHVRLRSGRYSIEIWDRMILLSPRDVFWFQFQVHPAATKDGHVSVEICSDDTGTLRHSGLIGASETSYSAYLDPDIIRQFKTTYPNATDPQLWEEMTQGYLEVIGLWALPNAINGVGFPVDSLTGPKIMSALWTDNQAFPCYYPDGTQDYGNNVGVLYGVDQSARACALDVEKYLMGHVFMGDFTNGLYFGYTMRAIKDFRYKGEGVGYRDCAVRNGDEFQCLNAQKKPYNNALILYAGYGTDTAYTEPDWATSFGPTWNDGSDYHNSGWAAVDSFSLDDFEDAIVKQYLYADFFNGGFSYKDGKGGTFTLAAIAFPTKYLHYFYDCASGLYDRVNGICAVDISFPNPRSCGARLTQVGAQANGYSNTDCWPVGYQDKGAGVRAKLDLEYTIDVVGLSTGIWNLAEVPAGSGSPFKTISLPWEVNFVPIGDLSLKKLTPFCFLTTDTPYTPYAEATYPKWNAGWFLMDSFQLLNDPRWSRYDVRGYCPSKFPLLGYNGKAKLAVSGQIMDWEFTNFSHGRSYEPSWDNPAIKCDDSNIWYPDDHPFYEGYCCSNGGANE